MKKKDMFFDWQLNSNCPLSYKIYRSDLRYLPPVKETHSAVHLVMVQKGQRGFSSAGETMTAVPGDFILTAPWEPHYSIFRSANHQVLLFNIDWSSFRNCFFTGREKLDGIFHLSPSDRLIHFREKLKSSPLPGKLYTTALLPDSDTKILMLWSLLQQLFITVLPEKVPEEYSFKNYGRLFPALRGISNRMLSLNQAADLCNLSTSHFAQLFKKHFGISFTKYERNFRLNGAADAIRGGATLKEAACEWDFSDKCHLSRLFKTYKQTL
ncbi:MAG: helix-turn-helix domain-containing protein [Lentisphaeria bacterium]|nr:helix-turn-helix domain-containing protein [Lentisphaeria bacterium]